MKRTWLIQRLNKPVNEVNPFSFGGGLKNGGLSDEGMCILKEIFSFDYMGAAEFEFGAIPESITYIINNKKLYTTKTITAKTKEDNKGTVYIICNSNDIKEIVKMIRKLAYADFGRILLKEYTYLNRTINKDKYTDKRGGWLELDNHFFFFTDKEMFTKTRQLFEL